MIRMLYVGGPTASEKGAVGTHTAGVISALEKHSNVELSGVFYADSLPMAVPCESLLYREPRLVSRLGKLGKLISVLLYASFVRRAAKTLGSEYIYLRFDPFFCFFASLFLGGYKVIVEYNDIFMDQVVFSAERGQWGGGLSKKIRLSWLYRKFIIFSEKKSFSRAYLVVAVTESLLSYCRKIGDGVNGVVVKNATDLKAGDHFKVVDDSILRMAHVGTLTYWDGLEELLKAISLAYSKSTSFDCSLTIVGDGKMKPELKRLVKVFGIEERVTFYDPMPRHEAVEYIKSSDVVPVLKTIVGYGLSPMKFYEAMGAGCHILASDVPHMNEEASKFVTNVCFPLSVNEISEQLLSLHLRLPEIRASRGNISRHAELNHSWDSRVKVLVDYLEAVR